MKQAVSIAEALQLIMRGVEVKSDLVDGTLRVMKVKKGVFEVYMTSDEVIDGDKEHFYYGNFSGLMKSLNGLIGEAGLYIEK